jgi:hypothetical protein
MPAILSGEGEARSSASNGAAVMSKLTGYFPTFNFGPSTKKERPRRGGLSEVDRLLYSGSALERLPRRLIGTVEGSTRFGQRGHK